MRRSERVAASFLVDQDEERNRYLRIRLLMRDSVRRLVRATFVIVLTLLAAVAAADETPSKSELTADQQAALGTISANSLRGHLSFLASDLLEGRDTPSRGLDVAAEYIAAQFRRAGIEPVGDDGYFQTANWQVVEPDEKLFFLEFQNGEQAVRLDAEQVTLRRPANLAFQKTAIFKLDLKDANALAGLKAEQVEGKAVVVTEMPGVLDKLRSFKAALVIAVSRDPAGGTGLGTRQLIDPERPRRDALIFPGPPMIVVHDPSAVKLLDSLASGSTEATVTLRVNQAVARPVKLRNVVGLLRGSDPKLKETYVLVTAHYDHVGKRAPVKGDNIYNGANDDGSGTVSVLEIASALAALHDRPKRSIVFMTVFGEEKGLLGSRYYGRHPIFPIDQTIADVNLEQVGRTDDSEGPQVATACMTGIDYSDVGAIFQAAGKAEGIKVYKHPRNSDAYFGRSDNQALADLGVPAHTLAVAFAFPDYHGAGDHWEKIDYPNMAKIDRMVARALLMIANDPEAPKWIEANPRAARYLKAYRAQHPR
jgi:hypothetical protein